MDPKLEEQITNHVMENIKTECLFNREEDKLPFALFSPETEGKLTWMCGQDAEGKITSVFCWDNTDKRCQYLEDSEESDANGNSKGIDKAKFMRDSLIETGWKKLKPPEITFSYPGSNEKKPLTRRQKRALKRKLERMNKRNPFN